MDVTPLVTRKVLSTVCKTYVSIRTLNQGTTYLFEASLPSIQVVPVSLILMIMYLREINEFPERKLKQILSHVYVVISE